LPNRFPSTSEQWPGIEPGHFRFARSHIASGLASILNATTPLFTVITAPLFLHDERASLRKLAGVVIGLAGVILMAGLDVGMNANSAAAELAVLVAAFCCAVAGLHGRNFCGPAASWA
jgi:drug/metabolite transporter (DMT)-like permease